MSLNIENMTVNGDVNIYCNNNHSAIGSTSNYDEYDDSSDLVSSYNLGRAIKTSVFAGVAFGGVAFLMLPSLSLAVAISATCATFIGGSVSGVFLEFSGGYDGYDEDYVDYIEASNTFEKLELKKDETLLALEGKFNSMQEEMKLLQKSSTEQERATEALQQIGRAYHQIKNNDSEVVDVEILQPLMGR